MGFFLLGRPRRARRRRGWGRLGTRLHRGLFAFLTTPELRRSDSVTPGPAQVLLPPASAARGLAVLETGPTGGTSRPPPQLVLMRIFHLVEAGRGSEPQLGALSPSRPVPSPKEPAATGAAAHLGLLQDKERRGGRVPSQHPGASAGRPPIPPSAGTLGSLLHSGHGRSTSGLGGHNGWCPEAPLLGCRPSSPGPHRAIPLSRSPVLIRTPVLTD